MDKPSVTIWNRLEGRPRSQNGERSLRGEIRDPLWMLSRQWQFGEFQAEDTGTAVFARVNYQTTQLDKLSHRRDDPDKYDPEFPLEANVEREAVTIDLSMRLEMGRQWERMLRRQLDEEEDYIESIVEKFREALIFLLPDDYRPELQFEKADELCRQDYLQMITSIADGRMIDGGLLYKELLEENRFASQLIRGGSQAIDDIGKQFVAWVERVYGLGNKRRAWHPSHLEYQFDCTAPAEGEQPKILKAEEYHGGRLDWYHFDYDDRPNHSHPELGKEMEKDLVKTAKQAFLPTAATYPGMPAARFWELEDRTVNFGGIRSSKFDTGKLLFAQFGLLYGNDWLNIPLEIPAGSLSRVQEVRVSDVFSQVTKIKHVHEKGKDELWGFCQVHDRNYSTAEQNDDWLFLPPVVTHVQESKPLEQVHLLRDEIANMVWGVEAIIPDGLGGSLDGATHAGKTRAYREQLVPEDAEPEELINLARYKYQIATTVPDNWIPFIAVKLDPEDPISRSIQLQRAAMPRIVPGFPVERVVPQTSLLKEGESKAPYYIYEEEVPRSGVKVELVWKRARWHNGKIILWPARRKTNGRGEALSNLAFDQVKDVEHNY